MKKNLRSVFALNSKFVFVLSKSSFSKNLFCWIVAIFSLTGFSLQSSAQSIGNVSVSPAVVCAGSNLTITFDVTNGTGSTNHFTNATSYQAYLSDAAGNNFVALGSAFSVTATYSVTNTGVTGGLTQTITIPAGTPAGAGYKISIGTASTTIPVDGLNPTTNVSSVFTINAQVVPSVSISSNVGSTICAGTSVTFTATPTNGGIAPGYQWKLNGADLISETAVTLIRSNLANADKITVVLTFPGRMR